MYNATNERIKRQYFTYLREAKRQSEASVDAAAEAVVRFEASTRFKDFKAFHIGQAVAFKKRLAEECNSRTAKPLSSATRYAVLSQLKRFFQWLAGQPGFKSKIQYDYAEYFNISESDARVATARREQPYPSLEQVRHVISSMPYGTDVQKRDRAVIAFTLLTGARDSATASFKLKHLDVNGRCVHQDAREVRTKFSKTFDTFFFPVGDDIREIVEDWAHYLRVDKLWSLHDPLFPATEVRQDAAYQFHAIGLKRENWRTASPIREIFKEAFTRAGLPYFNPHSLRKTIVALGESLCRTPEEFKAWSQNLGHEEVLTTFYSYGAVAHKRQAEIIAGVESNRTRPDHLEQIAKAVIRELKIVSTSG